MEAEQQLRRRIEEASINGWPGLQQMLLDGWVLRFANGFTKRANSVTPVYPGRLDTDHKLALCEGLYRQRGLPCIVRVTDLEVCNGLDRRLEARGYQARAATQVLWRSVADEPPEAAQALVQEPVGEWLGWFRLHSGAPIKWQAVHEKLLLQVPARVCPMTLPVDGYKAACGLGVLEEDLFGLSGLVVAPALRGRGYGLALSRGMLAWAAAQGARQVWLQVEDDNVPARMLYEKLGFTALYRYWYRVRDELS